MFHNLVVLYTRFLHRRSSFGTNQRLPAKYGVFRIHKSFSRHQQQTGQQDTPTRSATRSVELRRISGPIWSRQCEFSPGRRWEWIEQGHAYRRLVTRQCTCPFHQAEGTRPPRKQGTSSLYVYYLLWLIVSPCLNLDFLTDRFSIPVMKKRGLFSDDISGPTTIKVSRFSQGFCLYAKK